MRDYQYATSINFSVKTVAALRKRSAQETIRTGRRVTVSGLVRDLVERELFGEARGAQQQAEVAG